MLSDVIADGTISIKDAITANGDGSVSCIFINVTGSHTITVSFENGTVTVTFVNYITNETISTKQIRLGNIYGTFPTNVTDSWGDPYVFEDWYYVGQYGREPVTSSDTLKLNTAHYILQCILLNNDIFSFINYNYIKKHICL